MSYRLPPPDVVEMFDAPPTPAAVISPDRRTMLLVDYEAYPSIELLARPYLKLGGLRIDPAIAGRQRTSRFTGITIVPVDGGPSIPVALPEEAKISVPVWSHDSTLFAFTRDLPDGIDVWVADARTGVARPIPDLRVSDVLTGAFGWNPLIAPDLRDVPAAPLDDASSGGRLLVRRVPPDRGPAPETPRVPSGPRIEETAGKRSQVATYQDLLDSEHDEDLFEYYATTQLALVDVDGGTVAPIGAPGMITSARFSPDGAYLLVTRLKRPFSYRVPYGYFARTAEVWDRDGNVVATVADLPVSDEVPRQGVPTGPRSVVWQEKKPATLLWAEALDGGDPTVTVPHRDAILTLSAPFTDAPREVLRVTHRFAGWDWTDREDQVFLTEYDRDRRWHTTALLDLAEPAESRTVLFDLSINDAYSDPGNPVYQTKPSGERTMIQDGDQVYLAGRGASERGDRPFLDRLDLETGETERLFECDDEGYEVFVAFADSARRRLITRRETSTQPPNYCVLDLDSGERRWLTDFRDPHPQFTGAKKELLRYIREDGVPLSGTLYLPPGWEPEHGPRLPAVIWSYPMDYSDPATAGQVRGSDNTFTRLLGASPLWFLTQGYAVLMDATMPVVGDPETMNDSFIEQIVASARAAIDTLDEMGVIDRERVIAAGHSYGGFMTANLLAHTDLFAAGIARSGAYNRTLTPFGFQTERRSFWEAREVYHRVSPFTYADQIRRPLLLIHGETDNNSGTFTIQSERLFQAIQGSGGTARLVILPHESHGYRARESILHVIAEMFDWADTHAAARRLRVPEGDGALQPVPAAGPEERATPPLAGGGSRGAARSGRS
jgi:dipeptidyl aminopeptidase/acylaminoacyl peptidase